jgi:hypothetical protein
MSEQCNSCGAHDSALFCTYCGIPLCGRCRSNHEFVCEQAQKRKTRGLGPTIRVPQPVAPFDHFLQSVNKNQELLQLLAHEDDDLGGEG